MAGASATSATTPAATASTRVPGRLVIADTLPSQFAVHPESPALFLGVCAVATYGFRKELPHKRSDGSLFGHDRFELGGGVAVGVAAHPDGDVAQRSGEAERRGVALAHRGTVLPPARDPPAGDRVAGGVHPADLARGHDRPVDVQR